MVSTLVSIPGYRISEELYNGSRTLVYRGVRETDSLPVVIKLLKNPYPNFSELLSFRNQYTIAKNLNSPLIVATYSLEPYQNGYALVMEDFGGISLKNYFTSDQGRYIASLEEFLRIAIALCNTLDILYRERIIHKDIKPANILINPETKQVKLIDFSIASLLPRETQTLINPNVLEGTLAYISPEQTGRMNRGIDYRTDFYSLGVTFYELLTGKLPFASSDPMELVHSHIAKLPEQFKSAEIPQVLSDIVMKLMAKNAEDRYQSALGLKFDLENCLHQLQVDGTIKGFEIARRDVCDRFIIPDKLYGRKTEVQTLLDAFNRVSLGNTEIMLVAGFSGIGKTAVVNEVHKPIARSRGYFIKGKYDQFGRNIPFSAFVQAFRDLMEQLRSESERELQTWKSKILAAVGENGQVLIEVIPELENIIGKQPAVAELSGNAAQNRFNLLFQKFVQVFTSIEHPLVIFLDDLQWSDSASLKLLQLLMQDTGHLLILGAYRDNEVQAAHPFILTVEEILKTGATVNTITLQPLSLEDMNQLVADTLNCSSHLAQPLTELVCQKTQGNPFFATQFLKALHQDDLINFDPPQSPLTKGSQCVAGVSHVATGVGREGGWQCDIAKVRALAITDDVVEFMALQLQKLPTETQNMLKLAACIGAQFDLDTLAIVSKKSPELAANALWKSLQSGLIIPTTEVYKFFTQSDSESVYTASANPTYRFLHDRVQQAAYSLIPSNECQAKHLQIGKLLLHHTDRLKQSTKIFEIVNQLNFGLTLITAQQERYELAELNLTAARQAKDSTAYQAAYQYVNVGLSLLTVNRWESQYDLTFSLRALAAELNYLLGDIQQMEQEIDIILQHTHSLLQQVEIYNFRIQAYIGLNRINEAVEITLNILKRLGIELQASPTESDISAASRAIAALLAEVSMADLLDRPPMTNPNYLAAMRLLSSTSMSIYMCVPNLFPLNVFKQVELSCKYGTSEFSAFAYTCYGLILCGEKLEIEDGYRFAQLALKLIEKDLSGLRTKTLLFAHIFITHWQDSLRNTLQPFLDNYQIALIAGDLEDAATGLQAYCAHAYFCGLPLSTLEKTAEDYAIVMHKLNQNQFLDSHNIYQQSILDLIDQTEKIELLNGKFFNADIRLPLLESVNNGVALFEFYLNKLVLCYLFGDFQVADRCAVMATQYIDSMQGLLYVPIFYFYQSLIYLALCQDKRDEKEIFYLLDRVAENQSKISFWASHAPMNYQHKYDLVEAEKYCLLGQRMEAGDLYDRAIAGAKENQFINEEAIANELAAKFYLNWGKEKVAASYMQEAYYCYTRWGAKAKIIDIEQGYPQLLTSILQQRQQSFLLPDTAQKSTLQSTYASCSVSEAIDLATVLKVSQSISSEIELEKLLATLLQAVKENAGATKTALLLKTAENIELVALNRDETTQIMTLPLVDCQEVPRTIINYVNNSKQITVIDDVTTSITFAADPYLKHQPPQSLMCVPLLDRGKLTGIIYLENNLTTNAFTESRLALLQMLAGPAAIALENARLYQQAQQALADLKQAQLQIVQSEKMSALGNLVAGVAHEINNPVGFLSGNIDPALDYIKDLFRLLDLVAEESANFSPEIQKEIAAIDLEYIREDLPKLISSMKTGVDRIQDISTSLRTFSRADSDRPVPFNLHQGIDSTILILKHRLKADSTRPEIKVIKNYGNIPPVECYAGQLNQVFMNILANAIDALDESNRGHSYEEIKLNPNRITISTSTADKYVRIAIADNGTGMRSDVKQRIFDHLFTTKGVGKGTGLGLAIARQIIEETHGGKLSFNSVLGLSTEFMIEIPV